MILERLDPYDPDNGVSDAERRLHLERYEFAAEHLPGARVADAACGLGYGRRVLELNSANVVGFDIDPGAIQYARNHHPGRYVVGDIQTKRFRRFDAVVSLETMEHLRNPWGFIERLAVDTIVCSVPIIPSTHFNPFHQWDFDLPLFRRMVEVVGGFKIVDEFSQPQYLTVFGER